MMRRRLEFTIYHGLLVSLAIHGAMAASFVMERMISPPDQEPETLVVDLQGITSDWQADEKVAQETKSTETRAEAAPTKPVETQAEPRPPAEQQPEPVEQEAERPASSAAPPVPVPSKSVEAPSDKVNANNVTGEAIRQQARTVQVERDRDIDVLRAYVQVLSKKVQGNLIYPDGELRTTRTPTVSFTLLPSGAIRPGTLKIKASSGQAKVDESALKTIAANAPFDPPPRELTVSIDVVFRPKR